MTQEFTYLGFLTDEAVNFFAGKMIKEERDGCAVVGTFVKLENGKTCMPSKGDIFTKDDLGNIKQIK
jgi:hypothetical protein